ncbi:hypothetical protein D3W54_04880 [Komagataeibacter medellinensis]|uniref:PD-(D/E)XK endonuclease-like domain-containing protein n=1 Tax=Komagataeibacter medellinensis TaxID=1177712 RepID=A0ABQ6VTX8_9PROT|nr:PD-(D/E)XK nuclease family protein [Komagataeibacter medellinensis]KAB8123650.1 hypothetical protein D3W54_04880 [Komagataeibacter medellinensis]
MARIQVKHSVNPSTPLIGAEVECCLYCKGKDIIRAGHRHNKRTTVQLWWCHDCARVFSPHPAKGKVWPLSIILEAVRLYYLGYTRAQVAERVKEKTGLILPERTLSWWLAELRELTTYTYFRQELLSEFQPKRAVRTQRLHHKQTYYYATHYAKLWALLHEERNGAFFALRDFLAEMNRSCPHGLFQGEHRASQDRASYDLTGTEIRASHNLACRIAGLVLQSVTDRRRRHDTLQRFMLATDSVTVAVEVPIFLLPEDISALRTRHGSGIPLSTDDPLTGHVDFLQIRNGKIYILDYKPNAEKERPIAQLMTYALALSSRTGLDLFSFVCAWFDEEHYFEFYPRQVIRNAVMMSST